MGGGSSAGAGQSGAGGGMTGQAPYHPGENDRLPWDLKSDLHVALEREVGGSQPILLFVYSTDFSKDCCAANFERAVFRDRNVVELATKFLCVKYNVNVGENGNLLERFGLNPKKPAILLLDAEAGLLHKQQLCVNPADYEKALQEALAVNDIRIKLRQKFLTDRAEVKSALEQKEFAKAAKVLASILQHKSKLTGSVLSLAEKDLAELDGIAKERFTAACGARDEGRLLDAYKQFRALEKDFAALPSITPEAEREADALAPQLRKLGIPLH